jgi:histidinol dehydrogenase
MSESTRKPARRTVNNSAKAEITAVKTNSYVERVMSKLKEGPEATVAKYAKDVVKFYKEQIKLAEAEIEKNQTYLEEKQEEIQEVAENIDLSAIKLVDTRAEYIERKSKHIKMLFDQVDKIEAVIKFNQGQILIFKRLLAVYA